MAHSKSNVTVYKVTYASITTDPEIDALRAALEKLVDGQPQVRLAIDLSQTYHVSSRVLGMLVALCKKVQSAGGRLVIFGVNPAIEKVMTVTRLGTIVPLARDEGSARAVLLT